MEQVPWGVRAVQADEVPQGPYAHQIRVCIIDTGYDLDHDDLPGADTVTGTHSTKYAGNQWDEDKRTHGTVSAGIIAAIADNDIGIRGILENVNSSGFTLHISKGLDDNGRGSVAGVIEAIQGCIIQGCITAESDVISMSLRVGGGFVRTFS